MNLHQYITVSSDIQFGKPVFKGTRVTVDTLFFHLEEGLSINDFLEGFPGVRKEQAEAVIESAAILFQSANWEKINEITA